MLRYALAAAALVIAAPTIAAPEIGKPAPAFSAPTAGGKPVSLNSFAGKTVVLEWTNSGCPFVQKHYNSGNLPSTQAAAIAGGAVWLTVNSGAPGEQGHVDAAKAKSEMRAAKSRPTAYLLDSGGKVGRLYDARTTPHMFVIDGAGLLRYMGAIDSKPTADAADIKSAKNYVLAALADIKAGRDVADPISRPYGCSVKYGS